MARAALGDASASSLVRVRKRELTGKLLDYYAGPGKLDGILIRLPERGYRPLIYGRCHLSPRQLGFYFHAASLLQNNGPAALDEAIAYLDRLHFEVPAFAPAYALRADVEMHRYLMGNANLEEAFLLATRSLEMHPGLSEAYLALGAYFVVKRDRIRAGEQFALARRFGGDDAVAHSFHITYLLSEKRLGEALEITELACRRTRGQNPTYRHDRNQVRLAAGRVDEAIEDSLLLRQSHPQHYPVNLLGSFPNVTLLGLTAQNREHSAPK